MASPVRNEEAATAIGEDTEGAQKTPTRQKKRANAVRFEDQQHGPNAKRNKSNEDVVSDEDSKSSSQKFNLVPRMYTDDSMSEGGRVKERNEVLKYYKEQYLKNHITNKKGKAVNINCAVEQFGRVVGMFDKKKIEWVTQMGFKSLLYLAKKQLPRELCYWLMTRVNPVTKTLIAPNKTQHPIAGVHVHWILGLPLQGKALPEKVSKEKQAEFDTFKKHFTTTSGKQNILVITKESLVKEVESLTCSELEFKQAFLMWALCSFLCPTTCHRLSPKFWHLVTLAQTAGEYDWCTLVLDFLMDNVRKFAQKFYKNGYAMGSGGCTYILAIFYLDRLDRAPLKWKGFPRIQAWTQDEIRKAQKDDKLPKHDFGSLGCIVVSYNELHVYEAKDGMPSMSTLNVVDEDNIILPICRKERRKATSAYNPRDRWLKAFSQSRETGEDVDDEICANETTRSDGFHPSNKLVKPQVRQPVVANAGIGEGASSKSSVDALSPQTNRLLDEVPLNSSVDAESKDPEEPKKLIVLDINGLLADIVNCHDVKGDATINGREVFKRPYCDDFLKFCFEKFKVGVWTSRMEKNMEPMLNFLFGDSKSMLSFKWHQEHCTITKSKTLENPKKPIFLKELKKIWNSEFHMPWEKGTYGESNTLLLDDSPDKSLLNPAYTAVFPPTYKFHNASRDNSLGPGGELYGYLEKLAEAENVPKYVKENPFGKMAIMEKHESWNHYRKVIEELNSNLG